MTVTQLSVLFLDLVLQLSRLIGKSRSGELDLWPVLADLCVSPISRWCIRGTDRKLRAAIWMQGQGSMLGSLRHVSASRKWKRPPLIDWSPVLVRQGVGSGCSSTSSLSKSSDLPNKNSVVWEHRGQGHLGFSPSLLQSTFIFGYLLTPKYNRIRKGSTFQTYSKFHVVCTGDQVHFHLLVNCHHPSPGCIDFNSPHPASCTVLAFPSTPRIQTMPCLRWKIFISSTYPQDLPKL